MERDPDAAGGASAELMYFSYAYLIIRSCPQKLWGAELWWLGSFSVIDLLVFSRYVII